MEGNMCLRSWFRDGVCEPGDWRHPQQTALQETEATVASVSDEEMIDSEIAFELDCDKMQVLLSTVRE